MSEETPEYQTGRALVPIEERQVEFYDDELTAVVVEIDGGQQVFVPIRPICQLLGIDWASQRKRIMRDPIMAEAIQFVVIMTTNPGDPVTIAMPLEMLPGWLFGINASRVRPELRDKIIRYQRECFKVLWDAFANRLAPAAPEETPAVVALTQIRELGRAIMQMADEQLAHERRITTTESRLDRAAVVVGQIQSRLTAVEQRLSPGNPITDEQASEIQAAVHGLGLLLTEHDKSKNHFQGIFNELHRRFGVTSYKLIPQGKYAAVLEFLEGWRQRQANE